MTDATEFAIRGHEKIIEHYRTLLANSVGLSDKLKDELLVRLVEEERQLNWLLKKDHRGR